MFHGTEELDDQERLTESVSIPCPLDTVQCNEDHCHALSLNPAKQTREKALAGKQTDQVELIPQSHPLPKPEGPWSW